jgi:hypothetical protein
MLVFEDTITSSTFGTDVGGRVGATDPCNPIGSGTPLQRCRKITFPVSLHLDLSGILNVSFLLEYEFVIQPAHNSVRDYGPEGFCDFDVQKGF